MQNLLVENMIWRDIFNHGPYSATEVTNLEILSLPEPNMIMTMFDIMISPHHVWYYIPRYIYPYMDNFENLECISLILEIWKYISYFPKFGKYNAGRAIFGGYISWAAYCCHGKWRRKINNNGWDGSSIDVTSLGQAPDSGVACPGIVPRSEGAALGYEHNLTKSSMWASSLPTLYIVILFGWHFQCDVV